MKLQTLLVKKIALTPLLLALMLCLAPVKGFAQSLPELRHEQLLNGLRVLLWNRPGSLRPRR
jgi:hypothetical protein